MDKEKIEITHRVSAVVLNWNGMDTIGPCLESLLASEDVDMRVVVVDNASTDGSVEFVRENFPAVTQIELSENTGYCRGNNVGMRHALESGAEFVLLANNDIVADPHAVAELVNAADEHSEAGAIGGKIYYLDKPDTLQCAGIYMERDKLTTRMRGKLERDEGQYEEPTEVDMQIGCALLFRSSALREAGLFDPRFNFYHEEMDLCLRLGENGWKILYVPSSRVYHRSGFELVERRLRNVYYLKRNILLNWRKHDFTTPSNALKCIARQALDDYLIARAKGYRYPSVFFMAGVLGVFDFVRGRFGPHPKILDSPLAQRLAQKP